jgi:hypothetical protein
MTKRNAGVTVFMLARITAIPNCYAQLLKSPQEQERKANFLSPSAASVVLPRHTFGVVRDDNSAPFPASTDILDLSSAIEPNGFEIASVQPFYANLPQQACPSKFSTSGNWNPLITGVDKVNISWQEQGCGSNGVSAYALDVIVEGPIGVSAF